MTSTLRTFAIATLFVVAASLWLSPWIGFAYLLIAACYFAYVSQRTQRDIRELLRDPAAFAVPFEQAMAALRTKLKEGEQGVRDRDAELAQRRQITNAIPDGLFLLDRDNRIVWCNQSALVMHSLDAFRDVGKPIGQLIRAPEFLSYLANDTSSEPVVQMGSRTLSFRLEATNDGNRLLLARDVTERERLDRMRRDFVANVSHELRTPLTVVAGYVETIRDLPVAEHDRVRYIELIDTQTANMNRLVADLLTLARLENEQTPTEDSMVALASVARDALGDAVALSNGAHRFETNVDDALRIRGSAAELRTAISNLLSNAVRYTPKDGAIHLRVASENDQVVVEVKDTGLGIAPEHIPRLTERFYRVDRSRSRDTGGTGLGLAIVKHVAQRHRAQFEIESTLGQGSTFRLLLPGAK
ncbi:MAG: phosphate regulon sensor histidine kinase PhoR [Casimicrobium sp.]